VKISALDLSLTATGWAFTLLDSPLAVGWGTIKPSKVRGMERLNRIRSEIAEIVKGSDLVVCENYAFSRPNQAHQIGELHGIIRFWLYKHEIPLLLVAPAALKKFVTGKGNAEKDLMLLEVFKRWGHSAGDNNAADAIGLLYIGLAYKGLWKPTMAAQEEVLEKLRGEDVAA
jgi:crossover junction endodeoxyribonuclease RuvC